MPRMVILLLGLLLSACSSLKVDKSFQAKGYDHRIQWVVLHYTSADYKRSLQLLTRGDVSSHYLIHGKKIHQLVDERHRAWHAGNSQWQGRTWLNATTIGIEMVHPGYVEKDGQRLWYSWSPELIDALMPLLHDIRHRYGLGIDSFIGHADIAPQRKVDPGPLFPWFRLAQEGLIRWPLHEHIQQQLPVYERELPDIDWFQQQLARLGYAIDFTGELDEQSRNVLAVFQMKYRPRLFDGEPDAETAAILWSLLEQQTD